MELNGIDFTKPVILCMVASRVKHKIWDKEKMKQIIRKIIDKYNAQIIFNYGDAEEKEFSIRFREEMNNDKHLFTSVEAGSLRELSAMCANVDFFFGNEGGPRHIAQAFNVPAFAIYPPHIDINQWLPNPSERFQGIHPRDINAKVANDKNKSYEEKFDLIDPDPVWERLDPMLEKFLTTKSQNN